MAITSKALALLTIFVLSAFSSAVAQSPSPSPAHSPKAATPAPSSPPNVTPSAPSPVPSSTPTISSPPAEAPAPGANSAIVNRIGLAGLVAAGAVAAVLMF